MIKKPNLATTVVLIIIIEGLAIYLNCMAHPQQQPGLTIFIVILLAIIFGFYFVVLSNKNGMAPKTDEPVLNRRNYTKGVYFWIGAGVYSFINLILNFKMVNQIYILDYNILIAGLAVLGLIFNVILFSKRKK